MIEALLLGGEILRMVEELDRTDGFSADEVAAYFVQFAGRTAAKVKTADSAGAKLIATLRPWLRGKAGRDRNERMPDREFSCLILVARLYFFAIR